MTDVKLTLSKPITAHGEPLKELTLRKPTTAELRQFGQPFIVVAAGGGGVKADYGVCAALIAKICNIPPSSVDQLDAADFDELAMTLVGFTKRATDEGRSTGSPSLN